MRQEFCQLSELPQTRWLDPWKDEITVEREGASLIAYSTLCPHNGGRLERRGAKLVCPWHGAEFESHSGRCLNAKVKALKSYRAEILDGKVWVQLENS